MEDLNEMQSMPQDITTPTQENVENDALQPVVETAAPAATDSNSNPLNGNEETNVAPEAEVANPNESAQDPTAQQEATETPAEPTAEEAPAATEEQTPEVAAATTETPVTEEKTDATEAPVKEEPNANTEAAAQQEENETTEESDPIPDYSTMSREELLAAFNELMNGDINKVRNHASAIRNQFNLLNKEVEKQAFEAFLEEGGNKDNYQPRQDALAETFYKAYDVYRTRRQKMLDELEAQKKRNLEAKQQILEELRALIDKDEENIKQTYDEFNAIQEKWKAIGDVPRDKMNDLWQTHHFLIEQFFNKVKINKELRMLDLKRNLEQKIELCEKAEELIVETSITKAFKSLQELRNQWREIGPVPIEQNEETWQRFNNAANQIDERRREYYDQRKEELDQNLLAKQALIAQAEELTGKTPGGAKEWNATSDALNELLKLWKSIGPVPHDKNEEIWSQFKSIIDKHFADKKLYFSQIRDEQSENYNKKIDLCLRAEAIAKREDWKKATEEILALQAEWKETGAVSRKVSDKLWHRFRGACDEFFAKKGQYFKDIRNTESENLAIKQAVIDELKAYTFGDDKEENLSAIKDFQRRWAEAGHVPIKDKDRIQKEYRALLDGIFEKLRISTREAEETAYRERIQNHAGDTKHFISSERNTIVNKIEKMRSDLSLWENNLGFLANSKQADLLKEEFEKKMQSARQQLALLEARLRILDESEQNNDEK